MAVDGVVGTLVGAEGTASRTTGRDAELSAYLAARQPALLRTAYLLTGERASSEDLVQTALVRLYLSWDKVRSRESLDGYVLRIIVNEHGSRWRRTRKRREHTVERLSETPVGDLHDDEVDGATWDVVQGLPPGQRSVVVLRYYEGLSDAEIAATLGIPVRTVTSRASRALAALRQRTPCAIDVREER